MTRTKPIPMVIIALYLNDVQFGVVILLFMLVKYIQQNNFKEDITLIIYSVWF